MEGYLKWVIRKYAEHAMQTPSAGVRYQAPKPRGHRRPWKYSGSLDHRLDVETLFSRLDQNEATLLLLVHGAGYGLREAGVLTGQCARSAMRHLHNGEANFERLYQAYEAGEQLPKRRCVHRIQARGIGHGHIQGAPVGA